MGKLNLLRLLEADSVLLVSFGLFGQLDKDSCVWYTIDSSQNPPRAGSRVSLTYRRSPVIEMAPLQEETILFDPHNNKFCLLNRTAAFIWNQLATPASPDALGAKICESFSGITLENALRDARNALEEMRSLNFVIEDSLSEDNHDGARP